MLNTEAFGSRGMRVGRNGDLFMVWQMGLIPLQSREGRIPVSEPCWTVIGATAGAPFDHPGPTLLQAGTMQ